MEGPQLTRARVLGGMRNVAKRPDVDDAKRALLARVVVRQVEVAVEREALGDQHVVGLVAGAAGVHDVVRNEVHEQRECKGRQPCDEAPQSDALTEAIGARPRTKGEVPLYARRHNGRSPASGAGARARRGKGPRARSAYRRRSASLRGSR